MGFPTEALADRATDECGRVASRPSLERPDSFDRLRLRQAAAKVSEATAAQAVVQKSRRLILATLSIISFAAWTKVRDKNQLREYSSAEISDTEIRPVSNRNTLLDRLSCTTIAAPPASFRRH